MDGASVGSDSSRKSDGAESKGWIREHLKERWIREQSIDQGVIEGSMDQRGKKKERAMDHGAID